MLPTPVATAGTTEQVWYSGNQVIETRSQPWPKSLDGSSDLNTLSMCDRYVTDAAQQEPAFWEARANISPADPGLFDHCHAR